MPSIHQQQAQYGSTTRLTTELKNVGLLHFVSDDLPGRPHHLIVTSPQTNLGPFRAGAGIPGNLTGSLTVEWGAGGVRHKCEGIDLRGAINLPPASAYDVLLVPSVLPGSNFDVSCSVQRGHVEDAYPTRTQAISINIATVGATASIARSLWATKFQIQFEDLNQIADFFINQLGPAGNVMTSQRVHLGQSWTQTGVSPWIDYNYAAEFVQIQNNSGLFPAGNGFGVRILERLTL